MTASVRGKTGGLLAYPPKWPPWPITWCRHLGLRSPGLRPWRASRRIGWTSAGLALVARGHPWAAFVAAGATGRDVGRISATGGGLSRGLPDRSADCRRPSRPNQEMVASSGPVRRPRLLRFERCSGDWETHYNRGRDIGRGGEDTKRRHRACPKSRAPGAMWVNLPGTGLYQHSFPSGFQQMGPD